MRCRCYFVHSYPKQPLARFLGPKNMEAPGVEPGSRNASSRASTGIVRHLLRQDRLRRTGSMVKTAEVILALRSYGADLSSQPGLMASHPPAPGEQTGEGAAIRQPVRSCCSQSKVLPGVLRGLLTTSARHSTFLRPVETVSPPMSFLNSTVQSLGRRSMIPARLMPHLGAQRGKRHICEPSAASSTSGTCTQHRV